MPFNIIRFSDTVRELLGHVPGTVKSEPPTGTSLVGELGTESGMTPLHLAAYSGNENVVRLLLNSAGVQVEAATTENVRNENVFNLKEHLIKHVTVWQWLPKAKRLSRNNKVLYENLHHLRMYNLMF